MGVTLRAYLVVACSSFRLSFHCCSVGAQLKRETVVRVNPCMNLKSQLTLGCATFVRFCLSLGCSLLAIGVSVAVLRLDTIGNCSWTNKENEIPRFHVGIIKSNSLGMTATGPCCAFSVRDETNQCTDQEFNTWQVRTS